MDRQGSQKQNQRAPTGQSQQRGNVKPELCAGPSRFYTWDNTGGTANGLAEWYLMTHFDGTEKYTSLSEGYVRAKARRWNVSVEEAETAIIQSFDEVADVIEKRWKADPKTLSDSVRGPEGDRESYRAQVIERNRIRAKHHLPEDDKGHIMAVDPSEILLPSEEPDFRIYEKPWPNTLIADDLNVADFLTRNERHDENMVEPDKGYDDSWRANENSKWLLKDGEIIASYFVSEKKTRALLATYLGPEVPLAVKNAYASVKKFQSISLWVNVNGFKGGKFTVKLNSNSVTIAIVKCDPDAEGQPSADGQWKRLVMSFANEKMARTIKARQICSFRNAGGTIGRLSILKADPAQFSLCKVGVPEISPQPEQGVELLLAQSLSSPSPGRDSADY